MVAHPTPAATHLLVLLGLMGAGKTTVAGVLCDRLGWPIHDNDAVLGALGRGTAAEIEASSSVAELHRLEAEAFEASLAAGPGIVTAAASVLDRDDLPARLADAPALTLVVWLDGPLEVLAARASQGAHRPEGRTAVDDLRRQAAARHPMLERVADLRVDTGAHEPSELADLIVTRLPAPEGRLR